MDSISPISLKPGLYLIATPIGNLGDMTIRALQTFMSVDAVLCEDTRVTGKLLRHFGIKKSLHSYNDYSDEKKREAIIERLREGQKIALASDAGMPLISDPGYKLVRQASALGLYVTTLPGANAPLAALQLSGLPSDAFSFLGFLPSKQAARKTALSCWKATPSTKLVFETAPRLLKALKDMLEIWGDGECAVIREITKKFEEVHRDRLSALIAHYEAAPQPKGEIVIVYNNADQQSSDTDDAGDVERVLRHALETQTLKDAVRQVTQDTGWSRNDVYALALQIQKDR